VYSSDGRQMSPVGACRSASAFLMQPCRHVAGRCVLNHALHRIEAASGDYGRLDLFIVSPRIHSTMGVRILLSSRFMYLLVEPYFFVKQHRLSAPRRGALSSRVDFQRGTGPTLLSSTPSLPERFGCQLS
jgi:hypothetical protein